MLMWFLKCVFLNILQAQSLFTIRWPQNPLNKSVNAFIPIISLQQFSLWIYVLTTHWVYCLILSLKYILKKYTRLHAFPNFLGGFLFVCFCPTKFSEFCYTQQYIFFHMVSNKCYSMFEAKVWLGLETLLIFLVIIRKVPLLWVIIRHQDFH